MNYKKVSVGLSVLGAVLLILGFTYVRADYCDYCSDDSAVYDGGFDYTESQPDTVISSDDTSPDAALNDNPTPDQYDYEQNGLAPGEVESESVQSPDEVFTNSYDSVLDKPAGQTLEEYYYGTGDQSPPQESIPESDLTAGYDSSLRQNVGLTTYDEQLPENYIAFTPGPPPDSLLTPQTAYPTGEINYDPSLSRYYGFSNEPLTPIGYTNYFNSGGYGGTQQSSYHYDFVGRVVDQAPMEAYLGGLLQMKQSDMVYVAPANNYIPNTSGSDIWSKVWTPSTNDAFGDLGPLPDYYGSMSGNYIMPGSITGGVSTGGSTGNSSAYYDYLANGVPKVSFPSSPAPQPDPIILPTYKGAEIRDQDIKASLTNIYLTSAKALGIGMIAIVSAGQPSTGKYSESCEQNAAGTIERCGARQHDNGNAGDIVLYKNGRALNFDNKDDRVIVSQFITLSVAQGATGIGAGDSYMGPVTIHVGYGNPAGYWGGGVVDPHPAPQWVIDAYDKGIEMRTAQNKEVQQALKDAGYYKGAIDGDIGPQSELALKAFQKANGLPPDGTVDGTVSPGTLAALDVLPPGGQPIQVASNNVTPSIIPPIPELRPTQPSSVTNSNPGSVPTPRLRPDQPSSDIAHSVPEVVFTLPPRLGPDPSVLSVAPTPRLRPGEDSPTYVRYEAPEAVVPRPRLRPTDSSAPSTEIVVSNATPIIIPPGPYGAEVLAKAILSGDPEAIAAAKAQVDANIGAEIVAKRANSEGGLYLNLYDLALNLNAEKAKANAQVEAYLTAALSGTPQPATSPTGTGDTPSSIPRPRLRPTDSSAPSTESAGPGVTPTTGTIRESTTIPPGPYEADVLVKAILGGDPNKIDAAQKQVYANVVAIYGEPSIFNFAPLKAQNEINDYFTITLPAEAPGAVREFQHRVENDPSIIANLKPDQIALLDKAFSNLPPDPTTGATAAPTTGNQTVHNAPVPQPQPEESSQYGGGEASTDTISTTTIPGAGFETGPSYSHIFFGYPTANYYFSPNTLLNTPEQNPQVSSPPLVHKDFSIDDSATVKNLYVYDPTTQSFFYGYQTLDSSASVKQSQSSNTTYYYYIPPTSGGGQPQEVATTIPPYYIGSMEPATPISRIYDLFRHQDKNNPNYLLNLYLSYRHSHKRQDQTLTPSIGYTSDTGSGFQPQLTWDPSSAGSAPSNVVFYVDYSRLLQDQNFSPYTLYDSLGNRIRAAQGRPPSLSVCSDTSAPSVAENCSFNLIPSFLRKDTASKIYWYITNLKEGDRCSITSSPSVMQPQYSTPNKSTWINTSGYQVTISQKTVFTLTCTSSKGITSSVSKTINIVPIIQEI